MSRLDPPNIDTFSQAQQQVHDDISSGPRGSVQGPLGVWLWRPEMASKAQALGQYCRYNSLLQARLSELAILITARYWTSEFEWQHHKPIALEAGLDSELVEAIRVGNAPKFENTDEHLVFQFATELLNNRVVSDATYQSAIEALGKDEVVDLVALLGYYGLISMTINVFHVAALLPDELS
jgi:4-carboxymuconolactone decarboxylase